MSIITEEMRYRKRVVEYAVKHNNNASAARRYHTSDYGGTIVPPVRTLDPPVAENNPKSAETDPL